MGEPMTDAEMDELWEIVRPACEAKGISRQAFEFGTRIIEAIKTPEEAEVLAHFVKTGRAS